MNLEKNSCKDMSLIIIMIISVTMLVKFPHKITQLKSWNKHFQEKEADIVNLMTKLLSTTNHTWVMANLFKTLKQTEDLSFSNLDIIKS